MVNNQYSIFWIFFLLLFSGCSSKNIHSQLKPDPQIMIREWTRPTRDSFMAGEKGAEFSNPVLHEQVLLFGNTSVGLMALYPSINQIRWVLPVQNGVLSELTVDKDSVYFGGGDGILYSVNIENGRINWQYPLRNPVVSRPTIKGGRLFVTTSDDTVYAFDAGSGQWLWHYRRRTTANATILGASAPLVDQDEVLAGLSDGFLVCLSVDDGKLKWEKKLHDGRRFVDVDAHPILEGSTLYIPSYDGALYALNRRTGAVLWRFDAGGSRQVLIDGQRILLPSSNGTVYALDKTSAKELWSFELDKGTPTQLTLADRYIIFASSYQYLYVLDRITGKAVYRYNVGRGSGFRGSPLYDPDTRKLYILSSAGNLMSFTTRKPPRKIFARGATDPYIFREF